ncbi:MAG: DUF951 domain-containing protein [Anaerolineae bacterium]|nr:DUF951 domain-containing protein [Anaerolineae bacterium]
MLEVQVGDIVTLKKQHPCGSSQWVIYRMGADMGLRCLGCDRRQMMPRSKFEKAVKKVEKMNAPQL